MNRIQIVMSADRNRCGTLRVFGAEQKLLAGPFVLAARATDSLAAANGNPGRDPFFRYGDPPSGTYRLLARQATGGRHGFATDEYGPSLLLLRPVAGDAALAEANGRYTMAIIGGEPAPSGRLRSTAGAFRLANADLRALIKALGKNPEGLFCQCDISPPAARAARVEDAACTQTDPISTGVAQTGLSRTIVSRREALLATAGAAGAFAARGAITFVAVSALAPAARAYSPIDIEHPIDIQTGVLNGQQGPPPPDYESDPPETIATAIGPTVSAYALGLASSVGATYEELPESIRAAIEAARDLTIETMNKAGSLLAPNGTVPRVSLPWVTPAAILGAGIVAGAQAYLEGNTDGAVAVAQQTMIDMAPEVAASIATTKLVAELPVVALTVSIRSASLLSAATAAIGLTGPGAAVIITSFLLVVGANTVVSMGAKYLTASAISYATRQLKR